MIFHVVLALLLPFITLKCEAALQEEIEALACDDEEVDIRCSQTKTNLAFYVAEFTTDPGDEPLSAGPGPGRCFLKPYHYTYRCTEDVRLLVNEKCAGRDSCHFNVSSLLARQCWGRGVLRLVYGCAIESSVTRYCNVNNSGKTVEGFIHNPGYPYYYPGPMNCSWTISADDGQHVLITVVDLALQFSSQGTRKECPDYFEIYDGPVRILHVCGWDLEFLRTFLSEHNFVRLKFVSRDVWPSRGFFVYYRAQGCPTLAPPEHGYLVYRNDSHAHYMCCARYAFANIFKRNLFLHCKDGNHWNGTVPPCKSIKVLRQWHNSSGFKIEDDVEELPPVQQVSVSESYTLADIMIPSVIMATMIVSNVVIVMVIIRMRRRQKQKRERQMQRMPIQTATTQATRINGVHTVTNV